jgi:hypothetical protein
LIEAISLAPETPADIRTKLDWQSDAWPLADVAAAAAALCTTIIEAKGRSHPQYMQLRFAQRIADGDDSAARQLLSYARAAAAIRAAAKQEIAQERERILASKDELEAQLATIPKVYFEQVAFDTAVKERLIKACEQTGVMLSLVQGLEDKTLIQVAQAATQIFNSIDASHPQKRQQAPLQ